MARNALADRSHPRRLIAAVIAIGALVGSSAAAFSQPVAAMVTGAVTSQPIGHFEFCRQFPQECGAVTDTTEPARLTEHGWQIVRDVNSAVNFSILPKTDYDLFGKEEVWAYPTVAGDCEDYVLLKRKMLVERGFPVSNLLITVVRKPDGEGHAVLTLTTATGDFILDNLADTVKLWTHTPYTYLKRQAASDAGRWVTIENGREMFVGSVD